MENTMQNTTGLNAREQYEARALSFAKVGIGFAAASGMLWGLDTVILGLAFALIPFNVSEPVSLVLAAGVANAALHDGFGTIWLALYNGLIKGKIVEYFRVIRTKPGFFILLAGFCGGPIAMGCFVISISMAGTYAVCISATYPILGSLAAAVFLKEKINKRVWIGMIVAVAGAIYLSYSPPEGDLPNNFYLGLVIGLAAGLGWGLEGVFASYGMDLVDDEVAVGLKLAAQFVLYFVFVLPVFGAVVFFFDIFSSPDIGKLLPIMAMAGLAGGMTMLCWYKAFVTTGVSRAMTFNITYALWSIVWSLLFSALGIIEYSISPELVIGAVVVTAGAILVVANPKELLNLRSLD
ncbi:MAG: DMT family transporter [Desulfobacterales bacterium]|nr:DMT family transporter [Desulfobacterales bacterium]